ncbi:hypothetical protein TNCV_1340821 [Trichonephila clavipes]|nr:hypothetical protein TNCV_1340821 [Trichonephila clavipes]
MLGIIGASLSEAYISLSEGVERSCYYAQTPRGPSQRKLYVKDSASELILNLTSALPGAIVLPGYFCNLDLCFGVCRSGVVY